MSVLGDSLDDEFEDFYVRAYGTETSEGKKKMVRMIFYSGVIVALRSRIFEGDDFLDAATEFLKGYLEEMDSDHRRGEKLDENKIN